jgi:hypothetical protein
MMNFEGISFIVSTIRRYNIKVNRGITPEWKK